MFYLVLFLKEPAFVVHLITFFSILIGLTLTLAGIRAGACILSRPGKLRWRIYPLWPITCLVACAYAYFVYLLPAKETFVFGYYINTAALGIVVLVAAYNLIEILIRYAINAYRNDWSGRGMPAPPDVAIYRALTEKDR